MDHHVGNHPVEYPIEIDEGPGPHQASYISDKVGPDYPVKIPPDYPVEHSQEFDLDPVDARPRHRRQPSYISEGDKAYLELVVPLYQAAITGDWESAEIIFTEHKDMVRTPIGSNHDLILHMAVRATETKLTINFVDNLVKLMTSKELLILNREYYTAFWIACSLGKLEMAKIMLSQNYKLLHREDSVACPPITIAAKNGQKNTLKWLYDMIPKTQHPGSICWLDTPYQKHMTVMSCVACGFYDVALRILNDYPDQKSSWVSAIAPSKYTELLTSLAKNPDAFNIKEKNLITRFTDQIRRIFGMKVQTATEEDNDALKILQFIWKHVTEKMKFDTLMEMLKGTTTMPDGTIKHYRVLFIAAERGNTRFIAELLRTYPSLMTERNEEGLTIFHVAVMNRHRGVYNLLHEIAGSTKDRICQITDKSDGKTDGNTLLHLVGKTSKQMASKTKGASLLMQRELLWFQEVYKITPPYARETKNNAGQTPYELFSEENKDLVSKGLKWVKDCMVVATLIVTVAFAVAFTVPGGYDQDHGPPVFTHKRAFLVFVIADAISLFSSSTSLLVFLTILTSGHGEGDFMYSLPTKLMIGILSLFISVAAMMVTFSASFFVLYHKGLKWVPILIAVLSTVPVIVFAVLQFPLLVDMFRSMYDSHYLFNPKKRVLYPKKPRLHAKKKST